MKKLIVTFILSAIFISCSSNQDIKEMQDSVKKQTKAIEEAEASFDRISKIN